MKVFIEQLIIDAIRKVLIGRVNELLGESEYQIPLVEFGNVTVKTTTSTTT